MHILLSFFWLAVGAGWWLAFSFVGYRAGGYQWIQHTGQALPAAMNLILVVLCLATTIGLLLSRGFAKGLALAITAVLIPHLINAAGVYVMSITNGHAGVLMLPFMIFGNLLPTNSNFTGMPVGNFSLVLLPLASLIALTVTWSSVPKRDESQTGSVRET